MHSIDNKFYRWWTISFFFNTHCPSLTFLHVIGSARSCAMCVRACVENGMKECIIWFWVVVCRTWLAPWRARLRCPETRVYQESGPTVPYHSRGCLQFLAASSILTRQQSKNNRCTYLRQWFNPNHDERTTVSDVVLCRSRESSCHRGRLKSRCSN